MWKDFRPQPTLATSVFNKLNIPKTKKRTQYPAQHSEPQRSLGAVNKENEMLEVRHSRSRWDGRTDDNRLVTQRE